MNETSATIPNQVHPDVGEIYSTWLVAAESLVVDQACRAASAANGSCSNGDDDDDDCSTNNNNDDLISSIFLSEQQQALQIAPNLVFLAGVVQTAQMVLSQQNQTSKTKKKNYKANQRDHSRPPIFAPASMQQTEYLFAHFQSLYQKSVTTSPKSAETRTKCVQRAEEMEETNLASSSQGHRFHWSRTLCPQTLGLQQKIDKLVHQRMATLLEAQAQEAAHTLLQETEQQLRMKKQRAVQNKTSKLQTRPLSLSPYSTGDRDIHQEGTTNGPNGMGSIIAWNSNDDDLLSVMNEPSSIGEEEENQAEKQKEAKRNPLSSNISNNQKSDATINIHATCKQHLQEIHRYDEDDDEDDKNDKGEWTILQKSFTKRKKKVTLHHPLQTTTTNAAIESIAARNHNCRRPDDGVVSEPGECSKSTIAATTVAQDTPISCHLEPFDEQEASGKTKCHVANPSEISKSPAPKVNDFYRGNDWAVEDVSTLISEKRCLETAQPSFSSTKIADAIKEAPENDAIQRDDSVTTKTSCCFDPTQEGSTNRDNDAAMSRLEQKILDLQDQLTKCQDRMELERVEAQQVLKAEKAAAEERIQALQLRLYIAETRLKVFEDALQEHIDTVHENTAHSKQPPVTSGTSTPIRTRQEDEDSTASTGLASVSNHRPLYSRQSPQPNLTA
ncbi:hypothetical protein ACA910_022158 [Epithemia clementina (nom. ined.)]